MACATDGIVPNLTAKLRQRSSGSSSSRTRGTLEREATGGVRRRTEIVQARRHAVIGGHLLGRTDGKRGVLGPPLETKETAEIAEIGETGRLAERGVRVVMEVEVTISRVADEMYDRNGLT